jgi:hypothetical protein
MHAVSALRHPTRSAWPESFSPALRRRGTASNPTQIYLVCSARARVGKTLVARMIVEYCRGNGQPVKAFTINPIDVALNDFLPDTARTISLGETRGQMMLFDGLVIDDATTKLVDIGHQALDRFFTIAYDIEFAAEARRRRIEVIVAYVADPSDRSHQTYAALRERFPEFNFVPVFNDAVATGLDFRRMFPAGSGAAQGVIVPKMPDAVHAIADSRPFSFSDFLRRPPPNLPRRLLDDLDGFSKRVHRQLRETELSLLLNRLQVSLADIPPVVSYL